MTLADTRMMALERAGGGTLLRTLSLAAALIFALPLPEAVSAASATEKSDKHFAGEDAVAREMPSFGLPPIVVQVTEKSDPKQKTVVFKADLVFDEVDQGRIDDTMRVAKSLLPRIMDSVITGIQGKKFDDLSNPAWLNAVVLQRSNAVLKPYGVVVTSLRLQNLSTH